MEKIGRLETLMKDIKNTYLGRMIGRRLSTQHIIAGKNSRQNRW